MLGVNGGEIEEKNRLAAKCLEIFGFPLFVVVDLWVCRGRRIEPGAVSGI